MGVIHFKEMPKVKRIPSNVFVFDWLTGGGIPEGRFTLFFGDKSTNKSTMALRIARNFLRKNPDRYALYLDYENAFDPEWASHILKEQENLYVAQPSHAEEGMDILIEQTKSDEVGLYIIDSLAMMIPAKEAEADVDQTYVGLLARTVNTMLRRIVPNISQWNRNGRPITVILINQLRISIERASKSFSVPSFSKPGGKLQDAIASMEIRFYQGKLEKKKIDDEEIPIRQWFNFVIEKNKVGGIPKVVGAYPVALIDTEMYKYGDVADEAQVIDHLKKLEALVKNNKGYALFDQHYNTQKEIMRKMIDDPAFKEQLISYLVEKLNFTTWQNSKKEESDD